MTNSGDFVTRDGGAGTTLLALSGLPVEDVREGDVVTLPRGRMVRVERVDVYDHDQTYVVRWKAGRDLGSLCPMVAGEVVNVTEKARR